MQSSNSKKCALQSRCSTGVAAYALRELDFRLWNHSDCYFHMWEDGFL